MGDRRGRWNTHYISHSLDACLVERLQQRYQLLLGAIGRVQVVEAPCISTQWCGFVCGIELASGSQLSPLADDFEH